MDTELQYEPNEPQREPAPSTGDEKRRIITAERLSLALSIAALACFGLVLFAALPTISGMEAGMLVALLSIFVVAVSNIFVSRSGLNPFWIILMIGTLWVGTIGITLLHSGLGVILAVGIFTLTIVFAIEMLPASQINRSILLGTGVSTGIYFADLLISYLRIELFQRTNVFLPFIVGFEILILLIYLVKRYQQLPLFSKIFMPFAALFLFSIGIIVAYKLSTFIVGLISLILLIITGILAAVITNPVTRLVTLTSTIKKENLEAQLSVEDEIGKLTAFIKTFTNEYNQKISKLEERASDRSYELADAGVQSQKRSQQLEAISDISRVITTERDLQKLLPLVARMISEKFGFYHVGIFLIDRQGDFAVLRAANSEGGQRMLKRGHRLRVGQEGIIGYVTGLGRPRVALDVGEDAIFFNNPDLPQTRSEMGLPLIHGDQLIGALDVQSTEEGAFSEEEINLLNTLADQVTIAIENARLFSETEQALHELQEVQRTYLRSQWDRQIEMRRNLGFAYEDGRTYPLPVSSEQQAAVPKAKTSPSLLSIPIALRDEVIGYIDLQQVDEGRAWTEEEIHLAQSVAQQIGLALENARLIEETQHRAERESLVSQITTRLRASTDQQAILQTAVSELRNALRVRTAHIVIPAEKPEPGRRGNYTRLANRPTGSDQNSSANSKGSAADPSVSLTTDEEIG